MPYTDFGKNEMLDNLGVDEVALYNGIPGGGGTELSGGAPAYARQSIAFNAAATGSMSKTATDPVFNIPAGGVPSYVGFINSGTGEIRAYEATGETAYGGQGTYTLDTAALNLNA